MKIIKSNAAEFKQFFSALRLRGGVHSPELLSSVARIVCDVASAGDKALFKYTAKFDGYKLTAATVEVTPAEKKKALAQVKPEDLKIIKLAARRIEDLASGPGKLTQALDVTRRHYGRDVTRGSLTVRELELEPPFAIAATPRVGIGESAERPLRFIVRGSRFVSGPRGWPGQAGGTAGPTAC